MSIETSNQPFVRFRNCVQLPNKGELPKYVRNWTGHFFASSEVTVFKFRKTETVTVERTTETEEGPVTELIDENITTVKLVEKKPGLYFYSYVEPESDNPDPYMILSFSEKSIPYLQSYISGGVIDTDTNELILNSKTYSKLNPDLSTSVISDAEYNANPEYYSEQGYKKDEIVRVDVSYLKDHIAVDTDDIDVTAVESDETVYIPSDISGLNCVNSIRRDDYGHMTGGEASTAINTRYRWRVYGTSEENINDEQQEQVEEP